MGWFDSLVSFGSGGLIQTASQTASTAQYVPADTAAFTSADTDHDHYLSSSEFNSYIGNQSLMVQIDLTNTFNSLDTNKDGQLSEDEFKKLKVKKSEGQAAAQDDTANLAAALTDPTGISAMNFLSDLF